MTVFTFHNSQETASSWSDLTAEGQLFCYRDKIINDLAVDLKPSNIEDDWSTAINYANNKGVSLLLITLAILLCFWFVYRILDIELKSSFSNSSLIARIVNKPEGGYTVMEVEKYEPPEILKLIKGMILLLTVMVSPIFYASNTDKEIKGSPFINLTHKTSTFTNGTAKTSTEEEADRDSTILTISFRGELDAVKKNQRNLIKYVDAIWKDMHYYQSRFYKGESTAGIYIKWPDAPVDIPQPQDFDKEPLNRAD
jgi:hypothetical protein